MNRPVLILLAAAALLAAAPATAQETPSDYNIQNGENIYRTQCSSCHGPFGEGLSAPALDEDSPMRTYRDFDELVSVTADTMPPSQPGLVTGADAEDLVAYLVTDLDNPVSLPEEGAGTETGGAETGGADSAEDTAGTTDDGENGAPGLSAPLVVVALVAAALLVRRR